MATSLSAVEVNASVQPIVNVYDYFSKFLQQKEDINQAWEKCIVKEVNLGRDCLTDRKTKAVYQEQYLGLP
ncbi:hypothetical protein C0993_011565 [Termitomyces sp. T159_Od127]|nr:hypothetical protein C0993_011565 [Termitomyces sp. T159_Od127]